MARRKNTDRVFFGACNNRQRKEQKRRQLSCYRSARKTLVQEIYSVFWELRSLLQTTTAINEKYETKHGSKFTTSTIRLILRNPIYCVADEFSYNYFLEKGGNLFGDISEFDGQHGLSSYNKTDPVSYTHLTLPTT